MHRALQLAMTLYHLQQYDCINGSKGAGVSGHVLSSVSSVKAAGQRPVPECIPRESASASAPDEGGTHRALVVFTAAAQASWCAGLQHHNTITRG